MPFIPVTDTARVTLTATDNSGNEAVNVIHVRFENGITGPADLDTMLDVIETWLSSDWDGVVASVWTATRLQALQLDYENAAYVDRTVSVPGTALAQAAPSEVTLCMSLRTGFAGRSNRGRLYHIGLDDAAFAGDYMNPANIASLINVYESLRSDLIASDYRWVVTSYFTNGAPRAAGENKEITSIVVTDNIVDSMRSRKPRS